jgi:hypothetical protein
VITYEDVLVQTIMNGLPPAPKVPWPLARNLPRFEVTVHFSELQMTLEKRVYLTLDGMPLGKVEYPRYPLTSNRSIGQYHMDCVRAVQDKCRELSWAAAEPVRRLAMEALALEVHCDR